MSNFEHGFGFIQGETDPRDYVFGVSAAAIPEEYLPEVKAAVHDQGQINNCATHALSASLENVLGGKIAFGWFYGNRRYSDYKGQGTIERDLLKAAQKDGGLIWARYPYEEEMVKAMERFESSAEPLLPDSRKLTIGDYWFLNSFDEVRRALYAGKIVQLGFQVFAGVRKVSAESPVLPEPELLDGTVLEECLGVLCQERRPVHSLPELLGAGVGREGRLLHPRGVFHLVGADGVPHAPGGALGL